MRLSKTKNIADLTKEKNISAAYRVIGLLPERDPRPNGIGTATVDIFSQLFRMFDRGLGPVIEITADINPDDMPADQRAKLIERTKPMIEFVERVKAKEAMA
jgi:hypothetical protein